jgi:uncharacterized membrane protein
VYNTLLFLHVLSAFALMVTVVVFSAFALGAVRNARVLLVSNVLWAVGGIGTLIFGIWLAIYLKAYHVWDGWIITAIVLWVIANAFGGRAQVGFSEGADGPARSQAALMHWLRSIAVLALLVVMIYKPGA